MGWTEQISRPLFSCSDWFTARLQDKWCQGMSWHFRDSCTDWEISLIDREISLLPKSWRKWALSLMSPNSSELASQVYHFYVLRPDRNADEGQAEFPEAVHVYNAQVINKAKHHSLCILILLVHCRNDFKFWYWGEHLHDPHWGQPSSGLYSSRQRAVSVNSKPKRTCNIGREPCLPFKKDLGSFCLSFNSF